MVLALLAGGAWLLRDNGILLGRDADGPLEGGFGTASGPYKPGEIAHLVTFVRAPGHVVESVRFERVSPGLEVMGPVAYDRELSSLMTDVRRWPPRGTRPFRDVRLRQRANVGFGARATRPGFYFLNGVRYRSRKGIRRFDEVEETALCIQIVDRIVNDCPDDAGRIAGFEGLAEIGGPSDYGDARYARDHGHSEGGPVFRMRPGGTMEFAITISNLSGEDREVPRLDLGVGGDPTYRDQLDPLPSDPPAPFTIPAGGSREVRVRARYAECDVYDEQQSRTFTEIEAGDDDVELSVPVTVAAPCR
jgi:hypothetical protein